MHTTRTSRILFVGVHEKKTVISAYSNLIFVTIVMNIYYKVIVIFAKIALTLMMNMIGHSIGCIRVWKQQVLNILKMKNFHKFLVLDWQSNIERHTWISGKNMLKKLNRTFYYF